MKYITFWLLLVCIRTFGQEFTHEEISLKNTNFFIEGTLSYSKTTPLPLLIYVSGSGNVDRNGNQFGAVNASYIQQLSDSLNAHGIATFRFDKRTANPKNAGLLDASIRFEDFVSDVNLIIDHFKNDKRFSSVNLLGHSQGSLVAMLAIDQRIQKFISLAGTAENVENLILSQLEKQMPILATKAKEHFQELREKDTITNVHPVLKNIFLPVNQRFLKSWIVYQPLHEMEKIQIPVLVVHGDMDMQIAVKEAKRLYQVASKGELVIVPNMTHTLKKIKDPSENLQTYQNPSFPIPTELVSAIVKFLK